MLGALFVRYNKIYVGGFELLTICLVVGCFVFGRKGFWLLFPCLAIYIATFPEALRSRIYYGVFVTLGAWLMLCLILIVAKEQMVAYRRSQKSFEEDLNLARQLQSSMSYFNYDLGQVKISSDIQQSRQVGGDFFYFRPFKEEYLSFCLGDVMGKGVSASLIMAMVMSFLYERGRLTTSPVEVLNRLNRRLIHWLGHMTHFVSLWYGVFHEPTGVLKYGVAGHSHALCYRLQTQTCEQLLGPGMPLGIIEKPQLEEQSVVLAPGDKVVLVTDGITEARNKEKEEFSLERLEEVLVAEGQLNADSLKKRILEHVQEFLQGEPITDDMAILVFEYLEPGSVSNRSFAHSKS